MSTKIEWCDETWNPITGCTPISEGCKNCYAKRMTARNLWGYSFRPRFHQKRLDQPRGWKKPKRVFVCSMGDLFHPDIDDEMIRDVFWEMQRCGWHKFMVLTKRPNRMAGFMAGAPDLPNVWLGISAEDQPHLNYRWHHLESTGWPRLFISLEPLLAKIEIHWYVRCEQCGKRKAEHPPTACAPGPFLLPTRMVDWVICGAETGPAARPMDLHWARLIKEECQAAGVPFFMKKVAPRTEPPPDLMVREFPPGLEPRA